MANNSILASMSVALTANVSEFSRAMATARKDLAGFKKAGEAMKGFGENLSKYISAPLAGIAAVSLKTYGDIQALKKGLQAVAGSAEGAEKQFNDLKEVAKLPGLGLEEAVRGSVRLQAIGFSAEQAQRSLQVFGNAIATVGGGRQELERAIHGLQQLANTDFPLGEDLNILKDAIPQITPLLKEAFGTARSEELQKLGVSSKEVVRVITEGLGKLPPVTGGLKNSFENLSDSTKIAFSSIGDAINKNLNVEGLINALAEKLTALAEGFNRLTPGVQKFIVISGALVAAAGPILVVFGGILTAIPSMIAGYTALQLATVRLAGATKAWMLSYGPLIIQIAAITAAVGALVLIAKSIYDSWGAIANFFKRIWAQIQFSFANALLSIIKSVNGFGAKFGVEFKDAEASLQRFAGAAKKNLDSTPYTSLTETIGTVGQAMTDNLTAGMAKVKSLFVTGGNEATKAADKMALAGEKIVGSFKKQEEAIKSLRQNYKLNWAEGIVVAPPKELREGLKLKVDIIPIRQEEVQFALTAAEQMVADFAGNASALINGLISDSVARLGEAIGAAIAGGNMGEVFNGFLVMLADFAGQFGKLLISTALAASGLMATISNPASWPLALAAGIALTAAAGVAKAHLAKGLGGGATPSGPRSATPNYTSPSSGGDYGLGGFKLSTTITGDQINVALVRSLYRHQRLGG